MATYDTDALLADIRQRARAPAASTTSAGWADADLLRVANDELLSHLTPKVMRAREEFFVTDKDYPLVAGQAAYAIPTRALLGHLRDIVRIDSDGKTANLAVLNREEFLGRNLTTQGTPTNYYFQGNNTVALWPVPDGVGTLRLSYFRRPNRLVGTSAVLAITSIASATYNGTRPGTILATVPCDVVKAAPHFDSLSDDVAPSSTGPSSVTFAAAISGVSVGDYVCLAGESPVVQLPMEMFAILAQRVATELLRGGVDSQAHADAVAKLEEMEAMVFEALEERNDGEPDYIVNNTWA